MCDCCTIRAHCSLLADGSECGCTHHSVVKSGPLHQSGAEALMSLTKLEYLLYSSLVNLPISLTLSPQASPSQTHQQPVSRKLPQGRHMLPRYVILHSHCLVWEDGDYEFVSSAALFLGFHLQFVSNTLDHKAFLVLLNLLKGVAIEDDGCLAANTFYEKSNGTYHMTRFSGITHLPSKCEDNCTLVC